MCQQYQLTPRWEPATAHTKTPVMATSQRVAGKITQKAASIQFQHIPARNVSKDHIMDLFMVVNRQKFSFVAELLNLRVVGVEF
jgi:hypothetical protein